MAKYNKEKYYYFMLKSNFFDSDVIRYLQQKQNGYEMIILYFKLIFKAINKDGKLIKKIGKKNIPYTIEELSIETGHSIDLVKESVDYFLDTEMIEKSGNTYYIEDALVLTNQTTVGAMEMREYRAKNSRDKCKNNCKPKGKTNIDINNNKLELITNKKELIKIDDSKYQEIIDYFNFKTNSKYVLIDEYKKLINNILNKYKIEDIKIVIDKKTLEWINNPKMSSYLRPETLLGSKFERYLYQKNEPKTIKDITLADIQKAKAIRDNNKNG